MRMVVVQLRARSAGGIDAADAADAVARAVAGGADLVILPMDPPTRHEGRGVALPVPDAAAGVWRGETLLGDTVQLVGDSCLDTSVLAEIRRTEPDALVLRPGSESDLQAEAFIEFALGLSLSVAGLVVICDVTSGDSGSGWSAVLQLGEVLAEAAAAEDAFQVEVSVPLSAPEPREGLPEVPAILTQRFAVHRGARAAVDYLADPD